MKQTIYIKKTAGALIVFFFLLGSTFAPFFTAPKIAEASFQNSIEQGIADCSASFLGSFITGAIGSLFGGFGGGGGSGEVPVIDQTNINVGKENTKKRETKETVSDCLAWWASQTVLQHFTNNIVSWVNQPNGDGMATKFIQNYGRYYNSRATNALNNLLDEAQTINNPNITDAATLLKQQTLLNTLDSRLTSTFDTDYPGFDSDFSKGGWAAYQAFNQPQNNPFGTYLELSRVNAVRQETTERNAETQAESNGLPGVRVCVNEGPSACKEYQITTPGTIIAGRLNAALNSDIEKVTLSDEIDEGLAALFKNLLDKVFGGGGTGLLKTTAGGGGASSGAGVSDARADKAFLINKINRDLAGDITIAQRSQLENYRSQTEAINIPANASGAALAAINQEIDRLDALVDAVMQNGGGGPTGGGTPPPPPPPPGNI